MKPRSTNEIFMNIYIILKKLTTVFIYKSALRLRGVFALRWISIVLLYAFSLCVCFVLFCIVSWLNMFLALYLPINTLNLDPWYLACHANKIVCGVLYNHDVIINGKYFSTAFHSTPSLFIIFLRIYIRLDVTPELQGLQLLKCRGAKSVYQRAYSLLISNSIPHFTG